MMEFGGQCLMKSLAGYFLVARPILKDPSFKESVVLLLQHNEQGAFGLVINRPMKKKKELPFPVFKGGPCPSQGLFMIHGHPEWAAQASDPEQIEVAPGIFLGDPAAVERVQQQPDDPEFKYRMISGYAGWSPGQLEGEITTGAWAIVPATGAAMFDVPVPEIWISLVPPTIPQPSLN
jgi:putative transcriptional regulator